jgi:proline utilization trans-activator
MIGLDKPAGPSFSALHREHRKRLWWTSYCLDKNTSTEMGWKPSYTLADRELNYPSNEELSRNDLEEFHAPDFLTAQVKLTELKITIIETAYKLKSGNLVHNYEIRNCLDMLQKWESELTPDVALDIASGISDEMSKSRTMRTTSSLFLKYNHVSLLYFSLSLFPSDIR